MAYLQIGDTTATDTQFIIRYGTVYNSALVIVEILLVLVGFEIASNDPLHIFNLGNDLFFRVVAGVFMALIAVIGIYLINSSHLEQVIIDRTTEKVSLISSSWFGIRRTEQVYNFSEIKDIQWKRDNTDSSDGIQILSLNNTIWLGLENGTPILLGLTTDEKRQEMLDNIQRFLDIDDASS